MPTSSLINVAGHHSYGSNMMNGWTPVLICGRKGREREKLRKISQRILDGE